MSYSLCLMALLDPVIFYFRTWKAIFYGINEDIEKGAFFHSTMHIQVGFSVWYGIRAEIVSQFCFYENSTTAEKLKSPKYYTIVGRGWAKWDDFSVASRTRRLRQTIDNYELFNQFFDANNCPARQLQIKIFCENWVQ